MLTGKVILVTGAGRGLGRGIVEAVWEKGASVVATDLTEEAAAGTVEVLEARDGQAVLAVSLDVRDSASVAAAIERTVTAFGRLDGWVNNAGVAVSAEALASEPEQRAFEHGINVEGVFLCAQAAARRMIAQGTGGSIVNVSSEAGKVGHVRMSHYNATKAAVISLSRIWAQEWASHGINVNAVCPGGVDTSMLLEVAREIASREGGDPEAVKKTLVPEQLGRNIEPIEVGRVVAFLLSDEAVIIRGAAINCDGGDAPY